MKRLTDRNESGKAITKSLDFQPLIDKLARYEDVEERCIEECGCGLHMVVDKYKEFLEHMHELAECWELEKQGLLVRLPIAEGSTVYVVQHMIDCKHDYKCPLSYDKYKCEEDIHCKHEYVKYRVREAKFNYMMNEKIGVTVFLTKEEAEQHIREVKELLG